MSSEARREALLARVEDLSGDQRDALGQRIAAAEGVSIRCVLTAHIELRTPDVDEARLREFLAATLPEYMIPARFLVVDRLPRTPAGKLDRRAVVEVDGSELGTAASEIVPPRNETEETLVRVWRDVLGIEQISVHDDFFEIGGDSLLSIRAISRAGREGIRITPESFFEGPTIARLAALFGVAPAAAEQGEVVGQAPLIPIQHWFFERITRRRHHWNQAILLRPPRDADSELTRSAFGIVLSHHDALRTRFVEADGGWRQEVPPAAGVVPFRTVDVTGMSAPERRARIEAEANAEHGSLDLGAGKLFRAVYFDGGPDFRRLLLLAHHLVIDAESWGIVLEDLSTLVVRGAGHSRRDLPRKTSSALAWADALTAAARSLEVTRLVNLWNEGESAKTRESGESRTTGSDPGEVDPPPVGDAVPTGARTLRIELDQAATAALRTQAVGGSGPTLQELILASVLLGWCRWSAGSGLRFDVEGHGRDVLSGELDVSRTVGWFTTVFPVSIRLSDVAFDPCVLAVREAFRRLPMRGASHGLLRYLGGESEIRSVLAGQSSSDLLFNFLGAGFRRLPPDSPFERATETTGNARPVDGRPAYPVEINASVERDRLILDVEFDPAVHDVSGMEALETVLRAALVEAGRRTPDPLAAFDLSDLDEEGLQRVSDLLAGIDEQ